MNLNNDVLSFLTRLINQLSQQPTLMLTPDDLDSGAPEVVPLLVAMGMIKTASPANTVVCPGCEENCINSPVHSQKSPDGTKFRAFVVCDKRDDVGRVRIQSDQLRQWITSREIIARAIALQLNLDVQQVEYQSAQYRWYLGVLHNKKHSRPLYLISKDNALYIAIAGHQPLLIECFHIKDNTLLLDKTGLLRLLNKPVGNDETPHERQQRLQARVNEEKQKGTKNFNQVVAAEEGIVISRLQQILSANKTRTKNYHY